MDENNWVTGEAILWLSNDEYSYAHMRAIVAYPSGVKTKEAEDLLRSIVPNDSYGVIRLINDIDWYAVLAHFKGE